VLEADGSVGIWLGPHDPHAAIVIDTSISLTYASFLGGAGTDAATSVALDSAGNVYVAGTTNSAATFLEGAGSAFSTVRGTSQLFLAKIAFASNGTGTLAYLDFFGGSNAQFRDQVAGDANGIGVAPPQAMPSTTSIGFGSQTLGTSSAEIDVTVSNPGGSPLNFSAMTAAGANPADFNCVANPQSGSGCTVPSNCGSSIAPGGSCKIRVVFTLAAVGNRIASLTLVDNALDSPQSIPLSGTGIQPTYSISPSPVSFGAQQAGRAAPSRL
jgi:hypothetical protein